MSSLTTRMKEFRAQRNLTQEDLAKIVNVRRETITHLEKGKYNPSLKLAFAIAKALDVKVDELFSYTND